MGDGNFKWWHSDDRERWHGSHDTREEAIKEGCATYDDNFYVREADNSILSNDVFEYREVLERFTDINDECRNEDGDIPGMDSATGPQKAELEHQLNKVWSEWRKRHGLGWSWSFGATRNEEEITQ